MNSIFARLKALLEPLGITFETGGLSQAEIHGYSAGAELVRSFIEDAIGETFAENESGAKRYAALLNIDAERYTAAALVAEIRRRLAMGYACATVSEMEAAFDAVGSGTFEYYNDNGEILPTIKFHNVQAEDLTELGKFIESYVCLSARTRFDGSGMDFDGWDAWGQSFYKLDKMNLPFRILDELRSDMIE